MSRVHSILQRRDAGFSLIEVLVSLVLLALVTASLVPLLVVGARAATTTRLQTQAKNIAQERLEQMRQLAFHVDRQNGPFVDLLDYYYPDRTSAPTATSPGWVAAVGARSPGEPTTGAFYRTVFDPVPGDPGFTQTVTAQFLRFDRTPVTDATFAGYDSQVVGLDSPPSLFLGVSVVTTWTDAGQVRSFETFTQISDPGAAQTLIASQARAVAVLAESTAPDTTFLSVKGPEAYADGRLSDGSSAAVTLTAGRATREQVPGAVEAATATALAPSGAQPGSLTKAHLTSDVLGCGYGAFGRSSVSRATTAITSGVPMVPADVGVTTGTPANRSQAALLANPGGGCGAYWFNNLSVATDPLLRLDPSRPLVAVTGGTSGSAPVLEAQAWVTGTDEAAAARYVRAGASTSTPESVGVFWTVFGGGQPLLRLRLDSASISCDSSAAPSAQAAHAVTLEYRDATGSYQPVTGSNPLAWSSTAGPTTDPLAAVDLTTKVVFDDGVTRLTLADYVSSWSTGTQLKEGVNGVAAVDAALRLTTVPVRGASDPASSVGLTLGSLSCVADDNR